jgi:NAD(P)-dependent dehydrogenase (short-subunit alcohol dehydrogenase family)
VARDLEGRVAIVTGAARGIGLAIARRLAAGGARVALTDLDGDVLEQSRAALEAEGATAFAVTCNVADANACASAVASIAEHFGDLHILVNNAGLMDDVMLHRMTDEQWDRVQNVNTKGCFNMLRAVAPWFRDKERRAPRRVVNIGSAAGIYGTIGNANYSAAKAGVLALTRSAAREWAPFGVTVNAVAPGYVQTRMTAARTDPKDRLGFPPEVVERIVAKIPVGRPGTPDDIAHAVAFLCSPLSGYITGETLEVNGGLGDLQLAV